ncbi:MAG: FAD-dependent oxidoreductase, partial [Cyanobacteria bacterium P01_C01_bin.70]
MPLSRRFGQFGPEGAIAPTPCSPGGAADEFAEKCTITGFYCYTLRRLDRTYSCRMVTRRLYRNLAAQRRQRKRRATFLSVLAVTGIVGGALLLQAFQIAASYLEVPVTVGTTPVGEALTGSSALIGLQEVKAVNGRPQISPLPQAKEVWECEVVVVGGTLGGVAAAAHAMQTGAQTCLIELTPWLGGQISSQGVSAIDESRSMRSLQNFSQSWRDFKRMIRSQPVTLPDWTGMSDRR